MSALSCRDKGWMWGRARKIRGIFTRGLVLVLLATGCAWVPSGQRVDLQRGQAQGPRIRPSPPPVPTERWATRAFPLPVLVVNIHYRPLSPLAVSLPLYVFYNIIIERRPGVS